MSVEERITKLQENMLVQAEMFDRFTRRSAEDFERHEEWLKQLDRRLDAFATIAQNHEERIRTLGTIAEDHEEQIARHNEEMAEFRAAAARLFDLLERFIRGQQGNGHSTP